MTLEDFLMDIEKKYPIWDWQIDNVQVWPYIKMKLHVFSHKSDSTNPNISKYNLAFDVLRFFAKWINFRKEKSDILFSTNRIYNSEIKGKFLDKFCDPLIEELQTKGINSAVIEYGDSKVNLTKRPIRRNTLYFQPFIYLLSFYTKIYKRRYDYNLEDYSDFINKLQELFPASQIKSKLSKQQLISNFYLLNSRKWILKDLIRNKEVKKCFSICFYDDKGIALSMACNELKIPCIDIQHGLQQPPHLAYNMWAEERVKDHSMFPSHYWCWDEVSFNNLRKWNHKDKLILGGNPWFDYWQKNFLLDKNIKTGKKSIIYSMQPLPNLFPQDLVSLINASYTDYYWVFRLHPSQIDQLNEIEEQLDSIGIKNKISVHTNNSLFESLLNAVLHITKWSTVTIEAAYFNIPTIFMDQKGKKYFEGIIDDELLIFEESLAQSFTDFNKRILAGSEVVKNSEPLYDRALKTILDE